VITALQMVTDALRLANVIDIIQSPSAEQSTSALRFMNQLLADWEVDGIRLGWRNIDTLTETLSLDTADERGVKYNLAVELCGDYGIDADPVVVAIANQTFSRFAKSSAQQVVADLSGLPGEDANSGMSWPQG
jgi:hypothetical protein